MRHAIRIQPYLSQDLFRKLRAYAAARSLTVSAVVADALGEYLERDEVEDAVIVRRLDSLTEAMELLRRDVDTLAVGFGRFVRYSFYSAPLAVDDKVIKRAEALYREFLGKVGEQYRAGVRFTLQVFPDRRPGASSASLTGAEKDGREGSGRS
jgi:hypothetical protein